MEVSEVIDAPPAKIFSLLNTPQKCLRFEREMRPIRVSDDKVYVIVKIFGLKRKNV